MKVTGHSCDVCDKFDPSDDVPEGWFVIAKVPHHPEEEYIELCSPKCITKCGRQMEELMKQPQPAAQTKKRGRAFTKESHDKNHQAPSAHNPKCPFCQEQFGL